MSAPLSPSAPAGSGATIAYNLAGIAVLVLLASVGFAYLIDRAGLNEGVATPRLNDTNVVQQTIAGRDLQIPLSWFRHGEQVKEGFASQVDLRFLLSLDASAAPAEIGVALQPRSRARASSALLDSVYLHQFADGAAGSSAGLVSKSLVTREGFSGETVWYDPLSPTPFVAKCIAAVQPGKPDQCIRTIHLQSGLAAILTFDASTLPHWREFDIELARWLSRMGAL